MGKIFLIKTVDTAEKHIDDFVACNDEASEIELANYTVIDVPGIDSVDLNNYLNNLRPAQKRVYRTSAPANQWSDKEERSDAWEDGADWKLVNKDPKYKFNFSEITEEDREILADEKILNETKFVILDKAVSCLKLEPKNDLIISITATEISK